MKKLIALFLIVSGCAATPTKVTYVEESTGHGQGADVTMAALDEDVIIYKVSTYKDGTTKWEQRFSFKDGQEH